MRSHLGIRCLMLLFLFFQPESARATAPSEWWRGYTLVLLEPGADPERALRRVQAEGGGVGVVVPPAVMLGWVPQAADARLVGRDGIRSLHREPLGAGADWVTDPVARAAVRSFDRAVRGELAPGGATAPDHGAAPRVLHDDAREPGPVVAADVLASLTNAGHGDLAKRLRGATLDGTSDYMTGTVSLTIFFVESDGSGSDPDLYDWAAAAEQEVIDQAVAGLSFWSEQAQIFSGCWVAFYVRAQLATEDGRCEQWREPVLHDSSTYTQTIHDVLTNFGYSAGDVWSQAAAYNLYQKSTYAADWAYCAFVAANPIGPNEFTDGYAAWAYLGGPFTALLQHSFSWPFGQVLAHETGHIFRACDEYYEEGYGGCTSCGPCGSTGAPNGNCESCNPNAVGCMMRSSSWTLCTYTPAQLGWTRTPCAPAPLPSPGITGLLPASAVHDDTTMVQIEGENFTYGVQVAMGSGVEVLAVTTVSPSLLQATVHVDREAALGWRTVHLTAPDLQRDSLVAAFEVRPTRRHYLAASGAGVYPFTTPGTAGTSVAAVIGACSENDTLYVQSGTFPPFAIAKSVTVLGGCDASFTGRDPIANPTLIQGQAAGPAARFSGSGRHIVLDGLRLRGGSGDVLTMPGLGSFLAGGGVQAFEAAVTLRHCVVEENLAGNSSTAGIGGGAFFWRSVARLEDCVFRANHATRGGGAFFYECAATLARNRFLDNDGENCAGTRCGAGIGVAASSLEMLDDVVIGNRGAADGGGLHLDSCEGATLEGVTLCGHVVTGSGGGVWANATPLVLRACTVSRDTAGVQGGGILAQGDSLVIISSVVAGNHSPSLGGGIHAVNCTVVLENATVASNNGSYASGAYLQGPGAGSAVRNSVFAGNAFGGCGTNGGGPVAADYNLLWGNGGLDYLGIAAGAHDLFSDPRFAGAPALDLHLGAHSPAIDSGDSSGGATDPDGSRNDRGAYGGPQAQPAAPPRPAGCTATAVPQGVSLAWQLSPAVDVQWYAVYRSADSTFTPGLATFASAVVAFDSTWLDTAPLADGWYCVGAVDSSGYASGFTTRVHASNASDAAAGAGQLHLHAVSPCSAGRGTWVGFELPAAGAGRLDLYTIDGRHVRALVHGSLAAGPRRVLWDGRDATGQSVAAGVYLLRLQAGERERRQKLVVTR